MFEFVEIRAEVEGNVGLIAQNHSAMRIRPRITCIRVCIKIKELIFCL